MYFKNTGSTDTWSGQQIAASAYYLLSAGEQTRFAGDDKTLSDIGTGTLVVSTTNTSSGHLSTSLGMALLLDQAAQIVEIGDPFVLNTNSYFFKGLGGEEDLTSGTNDVDILLHATENRLINGAEVWTDSTDFGSKLTFQVVDVDNVLEGGAGAVLNEFGTDWQIFVGGVTKAFPGYIANVPAGVYIRLKVNAASACAFYYNLYLHKK